MTYVGHIDPFDREIQIGPGIIYWDEKCRARFDNIEAFRARPYCPLMFAAMMAEPWPGYTGPNKKLDDYYVRVDRYTPKSRFVYLDVVGTGRVERMARSDFDRKAKPV